MDDLDFGQKARSSAAMALDVLTRYLGGEPTADATAQARVAATKGTRTPFGRSSMDDLDFGQKARSSAAMALDVLTRYLGGEPTADATAQARVAATTLSAYTRYYQAEGAREAARPKVPARLPASAWPRPASQILNWLNMSGLRCRVMKSTS